MKPLLTCFLILMFLSPGLLPAQENSDAIPQLRKTIFRLQQEILQLKDTIDRQTKSIQAQKEELQIEVDRLNRENSKIKAHLQEMDSALFQMEDRLESSSLVKLQQQIENLRNFNQALILDSFNHVDQSEKLLLDILNQPKTSLPKDLLILILAQQKRRHHDYEESLSYYGTLLSDSEFFGSTYFSQAIFEMSEVFGITGKTDQQITLLAQLATLSKSDPYSQKALDKLKELGAQPLFDEDVIAGDASTDSKIAIDSSADVAKAVEGMPLDSSADVSSDVSTDIQTFPQADQTADTPDLIKTGTSIDTSSDLSPQSTDSAVPELVVPQTQLDSSSDTSLEVKDTELQTNPDSLSKPQDEINPPVQDVSSDAVSPQAKSSTESLQPETGAAEDSISDTTPQTQVIEQADKPEVMPNQAAGTSAELGKTQPQNNSETTETPAKTEDIKTSSPDKTESDVSGDANSETQSP